MNLMKLRIVSTHYDVTYPLIFSDSLYQSYNINEDVSNQPYSVIWSIMSAHGFPANFNTYYSGLFYGDSRYTSSTISGILESVFPDVTISPTSDYILDSPITINGRSLNTSIGIRNYENSSLSIQNSPNFWDPQGYGNMAGPAGFGWSIDNSFAFSLSILPESSYTQNGIIVDNGDNQPLCVMYEWYNYRAGISYFRTDRAHKTPVTSDCIAFWSNLAPPSASVPIIYYPTGCVLQGPSEAEQGDTVNVLVTTGPGRVIKPDSIQVYDRSGLINHAYTEGILSFNVPDGQ